MLGRTATEEEKNAGHRREDTVTDSDPPGKQRSVISDHRRMVVRVGIVVSWVLLGVFAGFAISHGVIGEPEVWVPMLGLGVAAAVVTAVPWRRIIDLPIGDVVAVAWAGALVVGLVATNEVRNGPPLLAGYAAVVVLAAALLLRPALLALVSGLTAAGYLLAVAGSPASLSAAEVVVGLATLGVVALLALLLSLSLGRHLSATEEQLAALQQRKAELQAREADLTRLYAVSRTIGAGTSIGEVLPELVSRVAGSVDAKVGVVLFYSPEQNALEVISPIWVAGHALRAEGYRLLLTERGLAQRVFIASEPAMENDAGSFEDDPLLADLADDNVAAVPLRLESQTIGVLMVTDKWRGPFTDADLDVLESLSAPAALILNHLARFQEAQDTTARMEELARLKTDFVSTVSHELRTPLTSIIGALATLARPQLAPEDPSARQLLDSARKQATRLKGLIEDLLVVSRLDGRALPVRPEPIEFPAFIKELIQSLPGADNVIRLDIADDLGGFQADPEHLSRVLINLIENSFRYASGSPVDIGAHPVGREVRIRVADHGPGIPYELHDHVFDRFTQVDAHEVRRGAGAGLGLSIVRGLTEAMGGRVWFEPTLGGGATFVVALPRRPGVVERDPR